MFSAIKIHHNEKCKSNNKITPETKLTVVPDIPEIYRNEVESVESGSLNPWLLPETFVGRYYFTFCMGRKRGHLKDKSYKCKLCSYQSSVLLYMKDHIRIKHGIVELVFINFVT